METFTLYAILFGAAFLLCLLGLGIILIINNTSSTQTNNLNGSQQSSPGSDIMDEVACMSQKGCIWGVDRAYCMPGYTGSMCEG